ncbi:MAG: DsbA family protein, partial [Nanoarchaeota archaeon]|nr:DsbA family protein [Nanoarchaeota archaeon]
DTCWQQVAEDLGIDTESVQTCFEDKKIQFAAPDLEIGNKLGVRGSPSVFIDGKTYGGSRNAEGYKQALCAAFDQEAPDACDDVIVSDAPAAPVEGGCGA